MKNIILIGKMNDVMRNIYECLVTEFSVQLCDNNEESVRGIVKICNPDMAILGCFGSDSVQSSIFELFSTKFDDIPVLVIANEEERVKYEEYCSKKQFELLLRPTTNLLLLDCCMKLLKTKRHVEPEKVEIKKKKLLVVDDSPLMLRNLKSLLEDYYTLFLATSGEQALKFIPTKNPDLVLLDYEMPGMNGKETFEAMRNDENAKDIPVIFLTSISEKNQIIDVLKYCPADYILKPPSREDLLSRIESVFDKKEENQ